MMFGESITIILPGADSGEVDEQGNPVTDEPTETVSAGWAVAPATAAESSEPFAQQLIVGYTLYKRDVIEDVPSTARIIVRGEVWAVTGQTGDWVNPYDGFQGTVVNVKAVG